MKVGVLSLMTTFLLALPLAALAGTNPCPPPDDDTDGDVICDSVDNCIDTPNTPQTDTDGDGQGDVCDNCVVVPNGPTVILPGGYPGRNGWGTGPGVHGTPTPGLQCDTNHDGYGNACDYDLDNNGAVLVNDISLQFNPVFNLPGVFVFVGNNVNNAKVDPRAQECDFNCDNLIASNDVSSLLNVYWQVGPITGATHNSRSGLSCAVPYTGPGTCPPHN